MRDRLDELAKKSHEPNIDPANFVTWDRLEDAFNSGRESVEKSPHQPSTGMASTRDTRSTENQTVNIFLFDQSNVTFSSLFP